MHYLKLFGTLLKINLQQDLAYRADILVNVLVNIMWLGWELLGLNILFSNTTSLGGWGLGDVVALLGVFRLVNTLMISLIWPNTEKFNTGVRDSPWISGVRDPEYAHSAHMRATSAISAASARDTMAVNHARNTSCGAFVNARAIARGAMPPSPAAARNASAAARDPAANTSDDPANAANAPNVNPGRRCMASRASRIARRASLTPLL